MQKHFAATAYIVSQVDGEVKLLLHRHKKIGIWVGVGGHVESDENPQEAVLREVKEEICASVKLINTRLSLIKTKYVSELIPPFTIIEEKILSKPNELAHFHIDCIYFGILKNYKLARMEEEFHWFSEKELDYVELTKETRYVAQNAIRAGSQFL